jgi:hypothetical protein
MCIMLSNSLRISTDESATHAVVVLGVGTAWIAGLLPRTDVTVITAEKDSATAACLARLR